MYENVLKMKSYLESQLLQIQKMEMQLQMMERQTSDMIEMLDDKKAIAAYIKDI